MISIIVPIYKVERYLSECIESVLCQSHQDWELLLVDDGSPDSCPVICDEYAAKDYRIRPIHKPNGGVSSARNRGLQEATGEWVMFVDADDKLAGNTLEMCLAQSKQDNSDIVCFDFQPIMEDGSLINIPGKSFSGIVDNVQFSKYVLYSGKIGGEVWGKLYRKSLLQGKEFDSLLKIGEDVLFLFRSLYNTNFTASVITERLYLYRINEAGVIHSNRSKMYDMTWAFVRRCIEVLHDIEKETDGMYSPNLAFVIVTNTLNNFNGRVCRYSDEHFTILRQYSPYIKELSPSHYQKVSRILNMGKFRACIYMTFKSFRKNMKSDIKLCLRKIGLI